MNKDVFKTLIVEGQEELQEVELYQRPFEFEEEGRYVLVGIRQAGKSYLLYQRAKQLMLQGHGVKDMIYINFDDERLLGMTADLANAAPLLNLFLLILGIFTFLMTDLALERATLLWHKKFRKRFFR